MNINNLIIFIQIINMIIRTDALEPRIVAMFGLASIQYLMACNDAQSEEGELINYYDNQRWKVWQQVLINIDEIENPYEE